MALDWKAEGPVRITRSVIEAGWKRRAAGARLVIRDADCRGLSLVVNQTSMLWRVELKPRGKDPVTGRRPASQSITIGNPATHSPDAARHEASRIKGEAAAGADPAAARRASAVAASRKRANTLGRLMEEYAAALPSRPKLRGAGLPSPRHVGDELAQTRAALAAMDANNMPAADLTIQDVRRMLTACSSIPATARARYGALSRFLDWCQEAGSLSVNVCALLSRQGRPKTVQPRSHFLTIDQLATLWNSAAELHQPVWRDIAKFLIAVPCRRSEARHMDWSHLDLSACEWRQPAKLTKNGEPHRVHLHHLAVALLLTRHDEAGAPRSGLVFPAPRSGKPLDSLSDMKTALDKAADLRGWVWHDYRRSFVTMLAEAGVAEPVADAILNHRQSATRGGVMGVYQKASRWPEQVRAMDAWGEMLEAAIEGRAPAGRVVILHPRSKAAGAV